MLCLTLAKALQEDTRSNTKNHGGKFVVLFE